MFSVVCCLVFVGSAWGQGIFQFVWHGNSNFFQASFIVTDAEMQGAPFSSPEFTNSVSVSSLSGILYNLKDDENLIIGGVNPWSFEITLLDFTHGTEIFVDGGEPPRGAMAGAIEEKPFSGSDLFHETGYWTYVAIPEPRAGVLFVVAGLFLFRKRTL